MKNFLKINENAEDANYEVIFFFLFQLFKLHIFFKQIQPLTEEDLKKENLNNPRFDKDKIIDYVLVYKDDLLKERERKHYLKNLELAGLLLRIHV